MAGNQRYGLVDANEEAETSQEKQMTLWLFRRYQNSRYTYKLGSISIKEFNFNIFACSREYSSERFLMLINWVPGFVFQSIEKLAKGWQLWGMMMLTPQLLRLQRRDELEGFSPIQQEQPVNSIFSHYFFYFSRRAELLQSRRESPVKFIE